MPPDTQVQPHLAASGDVAAQNADDSKDAAAPAQLSEISDSAKPLGSSNFSKLGSHHVRRLGVGRGKDMRKGS